MEGTLSDGGVEPSRFGSGLRRLYVFIAGALYGLAMRGVFGLPVMGARIDTAAGNAMLGSFVLLVPFLIGTMTVFWSGGRRRSIGYAIVAPWVPILVFVGGTALLLIEGSICIAMALPIFLAVASLGGIAMWLVMLAWRPAPGVVGSLLALPLVLAVVETRHPLQPELRHADASVTVHASPNALWRLINDAHGIQPSEMHDGLAWRIGVPYPQSALTVDSAQGRVRKLRWAKGVHFDEPILDWQPGRYIRWAYSFGPGAIPPDALDEHVVIGGRYFDLVDTSYRLTPVGNATRMDIRVTYRVSTPFNGYAGFVGGLLVDDAARSILAFYRDRAEARARS